MNIIYNIIDTINSDEWYGVSKNIEILKGKNKLKLKLKEYKISWIRFLFFNKIIKL